MEVFVSCKDEYIGWEKRANPENRARVKAHYKFNRVIFLIRSEKKWQRENMSI